VTLALLDGFRVTHAGWYWIDSDTASRPEQKKSVALGPERTCPNPHVRLQLHVFVYVTSRRQRMDVKEVGRRGGLVGGKIGGKRRAERMTPEERSEGAQGVIS
jgi:hypothetical protein